MNSSLEQLEKSVSEMIALYAGQEGIYCKLMLMLMLQCTCTAIYSVDSH